MYRWIVLFASLTLVAPACASSPGADDEAPTEQPSEADEQDDGAERSAADTDEGLDARLSDYEYPREVETFSFEGQEQDLEMAYMDALPAAGTSNGEVVLLLHGKNFSGAYWESTIDALIEEGYRVVVPDQVGFGKSTKPEHFQYSLHALAEYTNDLLDHVNVNDVHVVGHSMGGMLASRFALMFPEQTMSLTLVNPVGLEDYKRIVPYRPVEWWYENELDSEPEDVQEYMRETYFDGDWHSSYDDLVEIQQGWIEGPDHDLIAWNSALHYDMIFTQPVVHEFDLIEAPTLLIIGERDRTAIGRNLAPRDQRDELGNFAELGQSAAETIPQAHLELLEDTGHVPQYERPDQYRQILTDFLDAPADTVRAAEEGEDDEEGGEEGESDEVDE